ncbi:MAG: class I SAM-dependent methyltransferase [Vicinamibacteria bacterium]
MSQDDLFGTFEGNNWFQRNHRVLERLDSGADLPSRLIEMYALRPNNVLEVGAANGYRLATIGERYGASTVAVEPSSQAIDDGQVRFPRVRFVRGLAHQIPLAESFDMVIVNFVFHWIDRCNLLKAVAEIDRLLCAGGLLIIGDFFPSNLVRTRYEHIADADVYTYKQDYASIFQASGLYRVVSLITGDHSSKALDSEVGEQERIGAWLLKKVPGERYIERAR